MPRKKYFHKRERLEVTPLVSRVIKAVLFWGGGISLAVCLAYFSTVSIFLKTKMNGTSMAPTIENGKVMILNKVAYLFLEPKRFDVIVYKQSNKEHSYYEVKRVIGLPGEKVLIKDGEVFIDNERLDETIGVVKSTNGGLAEEGVVLAENEYFVLGDNREESEDSRFAGIGNILKSEIVGKAVFVEKPFTLVDSLNRIKKK